MTDSTPVSEALKTLVAVKGPNASPENFTLWVSEVKVKNKTPLPVEGKMALTVEVPASKGEHVQNFTKLASSGLKFQAGMSVDTMVGVVEGADEDGTAGRVVVPMLKHGWQPVGGSEADKLVKEALPTYQELNDTAVKAALVLQQNSPAAVSRLPAEQELTDIHLPEATGATASHAVTSPPALTPSPIPHTFVSVPLVSPSPQFATPSPLSSETLGNQKHLVTTYSNNVATWAKMTVKEYAEQMHKPVPDLDKIDECSRDISRMLSYATSRDQVVRQLTEVGTMYEIVLRLVCGMIKADTSVVSELRRAKQVLDSSAVVNELRCHEYQVLMEGIQKLEAGAAGAAAPGGTAPKRDFSSMVGGGPGVRYCNYYRRGADGEYRCGFKEVHGKCDFDHVAGRGLQQTYRGPDERRAYKEGQAKKAHPPQIVKPSQPQMMEVEQSLPEVPVVPRESSPAQRVKPWHVNVPISEELKRRVEQAPRLLEEALEMLALYNTPGEGEGFTEESLLAALEEVCLPVDMYVPGGPSLFIEAWSKFVNVAEADDLLVKEAYKWLQEGYSIPFADRKRRERVVNPNSVENTKKLKGVLRSNGLMEEQIDYYLDRDAPFEGLYLNNLSSADTHSGFVDGEISNLLKFGTVGVWDWATMGKPAHEFPIGVDDKDGKYRLICALLYVNFFEGYEEVKYEDLGKVLNMLLVGDWLSKEDAKAGYHNIPINPAHWKWLCFKWKGITYYFKYLPFGLSSAPLAYTTFMKVVNKVLRSFGERCNQYLDDRLSAAQSKQVLMYRTLVKQKLNAALGIIVSFPKCTWVPQRRLGYLGLVVITDIPAPDLPLGMVRGFGVPQKRMTVVMQRAAELLSLKAVTKRKLASFYGIVMSLSRAIQIARLYLQDIHFNMCEGEDWNTMVMLDDASILQITWWKNNINSFTGARSIRPLREEGLCLVVDSSASRHAGKVLDIATDAQVGDLLVDFPETKLVADLQAKSTLNETRGVATFIKLMVEKYRDRLEHKMLRVKCDNEGTIKNFNSMKAGTRELFSYVGDVWKLLIQYDVEAEFIWVPRAEDCIQEVDDLSKVEDISDVVFNSRVFVQITQESVEEQQAESSGGLFISPVCLALGRCEWGRPNLDVFANNINKKAENFYSRWLCTGTLGVNAYNKPWKLGEDTLVWCFPGPFTDIDVVIRKIIEERCDTILVLPMRSRQSWISQVFQLPVVATKLLNFHSAEGDLYAPGPSYPKQTNHKNFGMKLNALLMSWKCVGMTRLHYSPKQGYTVTRLEC